jgi:RecQ family ATP-dependent DNA helicase
MRNIPPLARDANYFTVPPVDDAALLEIDVDRLVAQRATSSSLSSSFLSSKASLTNVLRQHYRFGEFRGGQLEVIQAALGGRDVSIVWPTGQGKSLCYILPALASHRVTVVVSPLISLMEDQVRGINLTVGHAVGRDVACFLGTGQSDPHIEGRAFAGDFLVVYLSPEKLSSSLGNLAQLHERLKQRGSAIGLLAVDEAHCCSQWGHGKLPSSFLLFYAAPPPTLLTDSFALPAPTDFRPSFQHIGQFRDRPELSDVPIMALTATAGEKVKDDIRKMLKMRTDCVVSALSVDRKNLAITVQNERAGAGLEGNLRFLVEHAQSVGGVAKLGATIVYCTTQKEVDAVATMLRAKLVSNGSSSNGSSSSGGKQVMMYHAGLPPEARKEAHYAFLTGECVVLVATVAFGMGIDKADIRRVVHFGCPLSLEEYLQQIGRAGRDGEPSECVMVYSDGEMAPRLGRRLGDLTNTVLKQAATDNFDTVRAFAMATTGCRRAIIMRYFGECPAQHGCTNCDLCVARRTYQGGNMRDFSAEARLLLTAVRLGNGSCTPKQVVDLVLESICGSVPC